MTKKLVFVRHGQSEWNLANKFTGWVDVNLSDKGVEEAKEAGRKIKEAGIKFDIAYTSILKRAIKTCNFALEYSDQLYVPVVKSWRLNERHYGALQGLNKKETAEKYGDEQVHIWRRSYDTLPPALTEEEANAQASILYRQYSKRFNWWKNSFSSSTWKFFKSYGKTSRKNFRWWHNGFRNPNRTTISLRIRWPIKRSRKILSIKKDIRPQNFLFWGYFFRKNN